MGVEKRRDIRISKYHPSSMKEYHSRQCAFGRCISWIIDLNHLTYQRVISLLSTPLTIPNNSKLNEQK